MWGCEEDTPVPINVFGNEHTRCPVRPWLEIPRTLTEILQYYWLFSAKNLFPEAGAYLDQPNALIEVLEHMGYAKSKCEQLQRENEERLNKIK